MAAGAWRCICLTLLLLGWQADAGSRNTEVVPRAEFQHPCSRSVSRAVRKSLKKDILLPAQKAGISAWPRGCPLDPALDLWGRHEQQKQHKRGGSGTWTCGYCGKAFKSEHYLDLHMERRHMNETPHDGVCLADFCELFDGCTGDVKFKRRPSKDEPDCNNETMDVSRRRCEDAIMRCFPLDTEASRKLHAQYVKQYCRVLDCRIREEQRKEQSLDLMPVIVLLILICLISFIVFSIVVCCVDYSDDVFQFLVESGLASTGLVKRMTQTRETAKQCVGMDRTKCI